MVRHVLIASLQPGHMLCDLRSKKPRLANWQWVIRGGGRGPGREICKGLRRGRAMGSTLNTVM